MSIKVMNRVWDHSRASGTDLVIMLALGDRADEDGVAWPGIAYLCNKARVKERATQTIIRKLQERGELFIETGSGRKHTNYYIVLAGLEPVEIKRVLTERLEYTDDEAAVIVTGIQQKVQNHAPFNEERKGAKPQQKGAKLCAKGAKPRQEKVHGFAPDPSVNPSINPLSLCNTEGGTKLQEMLSAEYSAKGRRSPKDYKTVAMRDKWLQECEMRLAPAELEKAIHAALAAGILPLDRIVAYVAKWGTQPRPVYSGKNGTAKPSAAEVRTSPAKQDETGGLYI